jgi:hypothetical protein
MAENTHLEMHRDHQYWLKDGAFWRDEISLWKEDAQKALGDMTQLENALRELVQSICAHEESVNQHLVKITTHEHSVSEFEQKRAGDSLQLLTLAKAHKQEEADHVQQRQAHERLKKQHHTIMAQWNMLLKELTC